MATVAVPRLEDHTPPCRSAHRFTVEQYERMAELGLLTSADRVELLEGIIVDKMTQNPPHNAAIDLVRDQLEPLLPEDYRLREQKAVRLVGGSEPEPDLAVVLGPAKRYARRHPGPQDIFLVVEVADTSLADDRERKGRIYARSRLAVYWIVNLHDGVVEVYTNPKGGKAPGYTTRRDYGRDESVPAIVAGTELATICVSELLP
jgi:Uma2 family endonuclease